jgi:electron transfer flavoprotein beta subunit
MNIVVCVKSVPDATADRHFEADHTVDRLGADMQLSELDEYAVEQALKIKDKLGDAAVVTAVSMGPPAAADAIRRALAMGADQGLHVADDAIAGSDALATSLVLARAIGKLSESSPCDLVICGMASTDGCMGVVPAMLSERLGVPGLTIGSQVSLDGNTVVIQRDSDVATQTVEGTLPVVLSVSDQAGEPRYPSFKGIMAAKKKPVVTWSLTDLGMSAEQVGLSAAWTAVESVAEKPPRAKGEMVTDRDGSGADELLKFLVAKKFVCGRKAVAT